MKKKKVIGYYETIEVDCGFGFVKKKTLPYWIPWKIPRN